MQLKLVVIGTLLGLSFNANADEAGVGKESSNTSSVPVTTSDSTTESSWYEPLVEWFEMTAGGE